MPRAMTRRRRSRSHRTGSSRTLAEAAAEAAYPPLAAMMNRIGRERGFPPWTGHRSTRSRELRGSSFVGSPPQVTEKILFQHEVFGHDRFLLQIIGGGMPHAQVMRSIELLGTQVAPAVRAALAVSRR